MFELEPPEDDGLYIEEVGAWSADKHHFLRRYIDAFTTAMKSKPWHGLHYVDLFAGAGIERLKGGRLDWGSPLIAAQSPNKFACLHLCERKQRSFDALRVRVGRLEQPEEPQLLRGNANDVVHDVVALLPPRALTLAFLDPWGLHLHFETLRSLSQRRVDLIIFFPDHMDALRNWKIYRGKTDSNLDQVVGTAAWYDAIKSHPRDQWADALTRFYIDQIRTLGYRYFNHERITRHDGRRLYRLIFCSRHERGGEIWRRVALRKPGGQQTFDF